MEQVITAKPWDVVFWSIGGTAINQTRARLEVKEANGSEEASAIERHVFVDTSDSNMHNLSTEGVYRIPNIEGGGKDREKVKAAFYPVLPDLLMKHKPGTVNVVIFSLAGGTGSGIAPILMGSLLKSGHTTVGVCISDHTSSSSIINGISAMADFEQVSQMIGKPIVLAHHDNDPEKTFIDNDVYSKMVMDSLSILCSGKNVKLDVSDIQNFFNYCDRTHHQAGLAELHVKFKADELNQLGTVATVAAVLRGDSSPRPRGDFGYDAVGYFPINTKGYDYDLYFAVTPGMARVVSKLIESRDLEEQKRKVVVQAPKLTAGLTATNSFGNSGVMLP